MAINNGTVHVVHKKGVGVSGKPTSQQETVTLLGVGDVGGRWEYLDPPESIYTYVAPVIRQADIAFAQMEALWTDKHSSQIYTRQFRQVPRDGEVDAEVAARKPGEYASLLAKCGFNVASVASNHGLDSGPTAFLDHMENLRRAGITVVGGGRNIKEARTPFILERKGVRVAFLAYVSVIPVGAEAGEHSAGMAPMRAHTFHVPLEPDPGTPHTQTITVPYREDLKALEEDVRSAKAQAELVILSFHWGVHHVRSLIADYQIDVAHTAIDAGADLILGHHPHILKGIEVYKGRVCFYSMGNFLQARTLESVLRGRTMNEKIYKFADLDPAYPYYAYHPDARMSAVVKCLIDKEGIRRVSYLPVWINGQAQPRILSSKEPEFEQTVSYVRDISEDYFKTSFRAEGDEVVVE